MGQETDAGSIETEKLNMGSPKNQVNSNNLSKSEDGCSKSGISAPEELPSSNCCSTSSVETSSNVVAAMGCENRSSDSVSGEREKVVGEEKSWVVDVQCGEIEMWEGERVCRICHLSSEQSFKASSPGHKMELICLGCGCNGELGFAHLPCAEAWFELKGNRKCEICSKTVSNIRGIGAEKFLEEWIESGVRSNNGIDNAPNSSERAREEVCWHGQPFCNLLMACLVIAFVLPWFFRINGGVW